MIPVHEIIFGRLKKIPGMEHIKTIPVIRKIKDKIYMNYMDNRRKLVQKWGYDILSDISEISEEMKIPIWLDWGTLLGWYRAGKIIEYDYDLDVSTWELDKETHGLLKKNLDLRGFKLVRKFVFNGIAVTETYEKKGVLLDVDYYFGNHEHAWTYCFNRSEMSVIKEKKGKQYINGMDVYVFHTSNLSFVQTSFKNGIRCFVPEETERRIIEEYGEDWKIPIKDYDWTKQDNYEYKGFSRDMKGWKTK